MTEAPPAFYLPDGDGFLSTSATTSPWDDSQQHGGPPSALLARAIETCDARPDMAVSRISIDFLGAMPQGRMFVSSEVLRLGRRVELVEARLEANGRRIAVARGWRQQVSPGSAPTRPLESPEVPPLPREQPQRYFNEVDPDWGYGRAIEWRFVTGSFQHTGPAAVWARPRIPLVAGEQPSGLQRTLIVADSANGLSAEFDLSDWVFVPPTLTLTLYREPSDDWLLMDAATRIDPRGMGMAHATLSDRGGQFGVATQPLLVQRRSLS